MGDLVIQGFSPSDESEDYNYEDTATLELMESHFKSLARSLNKRQSEYKLISPFVDIVFVVENPVQWAVNCAWNELNGDEDILQRGKMVLKFINIYILMIRHYEYYVENFSHAYVLRVEDLDDVKGVDLSLWYEILPDARDQVRRSLKNYKFISRLGYDCTETKKASFK